MPADRSRNRFSLPLLIPLALILSACIGATNPVTGKRDWTLVTEEQELGIGAQAHEAIVAQYGYYENSLVQEYISDIGERLNRHSHRPEIENRFTVLDSGDINAFAVPGYIYITRGMLARLNSEAELAAVLGHELGHVTARHTARIIGQRQTINLASLVLGEAVGGGTAVGTATDLLGAAHVSGYGRDLELEADRLGAEYAARGGYDPDAMLQVIRVLKAAEAYERRQAVRENRSAQVYHGLFASHPDNDVRLQQVVQAARKYAAADQKIERETYLKHMNGLPIGPGEGEGLVRAHHFYHRLYDFTVAFPKNFTVQNGPTQVVAQSPSSDLTMRLLLINEPEMPSACDSIKQWFERYQNLQRLETAGYPGCQATVETRDRPARLAVIERDAYSAWVVVAQPLTATALTRHQKAIEASFRSLRPLTQVEYEATAPPRLRVIRAAKGDSYAAYARDAAWSDHAEDQLRLLNAAYPSGEPEPGQWVKQVN